MYNPEYPSFAIQKWGSTAKMYCLYDYCIIYMLLAVYADLYGIIMNQRTVGPESLTWVLWIC